MSDKLKHILIGPPTISLNLYEAETYNNAVVIQPLIGGLVKYSNQGRYEPLVAEKWQSTDGYDWSFQIKPNLYCENGEPITPRGFKKSLELSFRYLSKAAPVPIFSKLQGFDKFVANEANEVIGISIEDDTLKFKFVSPVRSGLVQLLSFAPFGFICSANRQQETGEWLDNENFVSSGPFKVDLLKTGEKFLLTKRDDWPIISKKIPAKVEVTVVRDSSQILPDSPMIIDTTLLKEEINIDGFRKFTLVPEYLTYIAISPRSQFKEDARRKAFASAIKEYFKHNFSPQSGHYLANSFYPNQDSFYDSADNTKLEKIKSKNKILIMGKEPKDGDTFFPVWKSLKGFLRHYELDYEFDSRPKTYFETRDPLNYDIRIGASSIGGGIEPWGINTLFCSDFGPRIPDPSNRICKSLADYENNNIDEQEFARLFNESVRADFGVVPLFHSGNNLYISENSINYDSISPLISVVRFDELELDL